MNKIVLYTVIINDYDSLKEIDSRLYYPDKVDYICITNNPNIKSKTYNIKVVELIENDPVLTSRFYKIIINDIIKKYDVSIYIDGKILLKQNYTKLINNNFDINGFYHPSRNCIYEEARIVIHPSKRLEDEKNIIPYIGMIKNNNFPKKFGLLECCFLIRKHTEKLSKAMEEWYEIFKNHVRRDQLGFTYIIWKHKLNFKAYKYHSFFTQMISIIEHKKARKRFKNIEDYKREGDLIECIDPFTEKKYFWNSKINKDIF